MPRAYPAKAVPVGPGSGGLGRLCGQARAAMPADLARPGESVRPVGRGGWRGIPDGFSART